MAHKAICERDDKTMKTIKAIQTAFAAAILIGTASIARAEQKDIVDTAVGAGQFTTLVKLVQHAGLVDVLKGKGPLTVFAPTDKAFAKLPKATVDALMADKEKLKKVLLYHVVAGKVTSADVVKVKSAKTVNGQDVKVMVAGKTVKLNTNTRVTAVDVMATNGVIHVIDTVLIPDLSNDKKEKSVKPSATPSACSSCSGK